MRREKLGRILRPARAAVAAIGAAALAAAAILGPAWLAPSDRTGEPGPGVPAAIGSRGDRYLVRGELVECWASEGFAGLVEALAKSPGEPTWEAVRRAMEERNCTGLRYALRVRWTMNDGGVDDITYVRRPYEEPWYADEFQRLIRTRLPLASGGPGAAPLRVLEAPPGAPDRLVHEVLTNLLDAAPR